MRFPHFSSSAQRRTALAVGGLLPASAAREGDFLYTRNTITEHGILSVHPPRRALTSAIQGRGLTTARTAAGEQLCYVEGGDLWVGEHRYPLALSDTDHKLIPFGKRLLIFPERKYLSLNDGSHGTLDAAVTTASPTLFTVCRADGTALTPLSISDAAPQTPMHGDYWLDTAFSPAVLRHYSAAREEWQTLDRTYLRLSCPAIGLPFRPGDTVCLTGIVPTELSALNALHRVEDCGEDHLVIAAAPCMTLRQMAPLTVSRRIPDLDPETVILCHDRLMGATIETDENGMETTVIYACRPGDPFNWEAVDGEQDGARRWRLPYAEPITAAVIYQNQPCFFTDRSLLRLSGQGASAHWVTQPLEGIRRDCGRSLLAAGRRLYYFTGRRAVVFDGEQVTPLPPTAHDADIRTAAAGMMDGRYYLSLTDIDGQSQLLVYQTEDKLWSRLDATRADCFVPFCDGLCYRDGCDGTIRSMIAEGEIAPDTAWAAETAPIHLRDSNGRLSHPELTLIVQKGARAQILIGCDGMPARQVIADIVGSDEVPVTIKIHPRAVSHFTLRFQGTGDVRLVGWHSVSR